MTIGERIALLRKKAGLSQEKLAELVGVSRQAIGKWESGLSLPGIDNLQELARVLQVSCDELITGICPSPSSANGEAQIALASVQDLLSQQTVANRRSAQRRFILSLLAVLLACLLALGALALSYIGFNQMQSLSRQLSGLESTVAGLQFYTNREPDSSSGSTLIADYDRSYTLLPSGDAVDLRISVLPKNLADGQSAKFSLIAGDQNLVQQATAEGGSFWGEFEIPLTDTFNNFKISFLLEDTDGNTTQELLFTETEFITQYTLLLSLAPDTLTAGPLANGNWIIGGRMALTVELCENRYPVSGTLELIIDGKTMQAIPLNDQIFDNLGETESDGAQDQAAAVAGFTAYTDFPIERYTVTDPGSITILARITDNLGKEHLARWCPE